MKFFEKKRRKKVEENYKTSAMTGFISFKLIRELHWKISFNLIIRLLFFVILLQIFLQMKQMKQIWNIFCLFSIHNNAIWKQIETVLEQIHHHFFIIS